MKIIANIFLFVFLTFLVTPTIVSILKKDADVSAIYNMSEEEHSHKVFKEIYALATSNDFFHFEPYYSTLIHSENLSRHDNISASIFIPPPDLA